MAAGRRTVVIDPSDNVATLVDERTDLAWLDTGEPVARGVPYGHKVAMRPIAEGSAVVKYGVAIGTAATAIAPGEHVHVHNVVERAHRPARREPGLAA